MGSASVFDLEQILSFKIAFVYSRLIYLFHMETRPPLSNHNLVEILKLPGYSVGVSGNSFPLLGSADFQRDHFQYSPMMGLNGQYLNHLPRYPAVKLTVAMHRSACLKQVNETGLEEPTGPLLRFQRRLSEWCVCLPKSRARGWLGAGWVAAGRDGERRCVSGKPQGVVRGQPAPGELQGQ